MSKRNAQAVINQYYTGWCDYKKSDRLRLREDSIIYDNGTPIAKIMYGQNLEQEYLIITLQNFKSQKTWRQDKKDLIEAALNENLKIIFVPKLDIGFGEVGTYQCPDNMVTDLIEVAKYSTEDTKTAVKVTTERGKILAYSYNQKNGLGEVLHAEKVLSEYIADISAELDYNGDVDLSDLQFISLLEPCYHCLFKMIDCGAKTILYCYPHKAKWNTDEYYNLTNDIWSKQLLSLTGKPIVYIKVNNEKVNKFMEQ